MRVSSGTTPAVAFVLPREGAIATAGGAIKTFAEAAPVTGMTVTAGVKLPGNGEGTLAATATISDYTKSASSPAISSVSGASDLTIMICNDPWPKRSANGSWKPAPF